MWMFPCVTLSKLCIDNILSDIASQLKKMKEQGIFFWNKEEF